jgi:alkylhydroperoxidase family enzyme
MDEARLEPLPPRSWPAEMREALAPLTPAAPRTADQQRGLNLLGTFARHPALTKAYHVFVAHLLFGTTLTPRQRELLILRVAAVRGADYEWAQHVVLALEAGLDREEIAAVHDDEDRSRWVPTEAALLAAVDELVADTRISDATWTALTRELSDQQLMDVVFTVGGYDLLAMALHTFGVTMDDDLLPWAGLP